MTIRTLWATRWPVVALAAMLCLALTSLPAGVQAQTASPPTAGSTALITAPGGEPVLLRSEPSYDAAVLSSLADGTPVTVIDGPVTGPNATSWFNVEFGGQTGYVPAGTLIAGAAAPVAEEVVAPPAEPTVTDPVDEAPVTESRFATTDVNLRASPSYDADVLLVIPAGAPVTGAGAAEPTLGFQPVVYNGIAGWVDGAYLGGEAVPAPEEVPLPDPPTLDPDASTGATTTTTTDDLNLRAGPDPAAAVLTVMPPGATVEITGAPENGFTPVRYGEQSGWAAAEYLGAGTDDDTAPEPASSTAPDEPLADDPVVEEPASSGGGTGIAWPFSGGTWQVIQGYNNGTHTNRSAFAQYQYSLDWARTDGNTAGQPVYAPVSGTIQWVDRGSGGMLIDAGNGYGVAFFHVTLDGGFGSGQQIQQGQRLGVISGPGGDGYASTPPPRSDPLATSRQRPCVRPLHRPKRHRRHGVSRRRQRQPAHGRHGDPVGGTTEVGRQTSDVTNVDVGRGRRQAVSGGDQEIA